MPVNGKEYAWEDINIVLFGRIVEGVSDIKYKVKREQVAIYGRGSTPVAHSRSKKEHEASITLLQSELEAIQKALPAGKDLTDLEAFDITVTYAPQNSLEIVTDVLKGCRFVEYEKGMATGDTHKEVELPLNLSNILYNV